LCCSASDRTFFGWATLHASFSSYCVAEERFIEGARTEKDLKKHLD
jgi:hypothetical protein